MKKITVLFALLTILSFALMGCENNSSAQSEQDELDLLRINTDLTLIGTYAPEGSDLLLCNQPFALCAAAFCEVEPGGEMATCTCPVLTGPAIGDPEAMSIFQPEGASGCDAPDEPFAIWSFFQPRERIPQAPNFINEPALGMACPAGDFVNCFGYPCEWDGQSSLATCTCEILTGEFGTQAGDCDPSNCEDSPLGIPSGASITSPSFVAPTMSCGF